MNIRIVLLVICNFFIAATMHADSSIVYNLRIAETTKHKTLSQPSNYHSIAAVTLFDQMRKQYNGVRQFFIGGLFNLNYSQPTYYMRMDFAVARARQKMDSLEMSRTQTDDIVFSAGYSYHINDQVNITWSGILGVPTHKDESIDKIQFGTGHVGLGTQLDGEFVYSADRNHAIMAAVRFIHFFPRNVTVDLIPQIFKYNIGNLLDIYIAQHSNFRERHRIEFGYNPTFLFSASIHPNLDDVVRFTNFIRSSFYISYKYRFSLCNLPSGLITGLSYSFDHRPKIVGNKFIVTIWGTWGINF